MKVDDFPKTFSSVNEQYAELTDLSQPEIIAEISPARYNLIDGNHRMGKARKMGQVHINAFKVHVNQHIEFLTDKDAYLKYGEYWNSKLAH